jgi:GGDEF domain-containing protein
MNKYESVIDSIFLSNNGEIDLLTGAISPDRFDQIVKRDLAIAQRNSANISMISTAINLPQFFADNQALSLIEQQSLIENELVNLHFNLKSTFRQSDCICRVSKLGFWILLNGADKTTTDQLVERLIKELPNYITVGMSLWQQGESILDWYKRVDQIHFNNNQ